MTTPSEFKKITELRQIDDAGLSPDIAVLLETSSESVYALLSQLKSWILKDTIDSLTPVGAPIFWPNDQIPQGYAKINDGLDFNVIQYPLLALAWPNGKIPPHKGLVIECTADGETTGETLQGDIKKHSHSASCDNSSPKSGNTGKSGGFTPSFSVMTFNEAGAGNIASGGNAQEGEVSIQGNPIADHDHNYSLIEHNHNVSISETGATRNTVDRINYNVIVRLA